LVIAIGFTRSKKLRAKNCGEIKTAEGIRHVGRQRFQAAPGARIADEREQGSFGQLGFDHRDRVRGFVLATARVRGLHDGGLTPTVELELPFHIANNRGS
jgi:hypothetical protein